MKARRPSFVIAALLAMLAATWLALNLTLGNKQVDARLAQ